MLAAYNWPRNTDRYRRVAQFIDAFFTKFPEFQKPARHSKWKEANLASTLRGWRRFPAAEEWLAKNADKQAAAGARPIDPAIVRAQAAKAAPNDPAEQERLFSSSWSGPSRREALAGAGAARGLAEQRLTGGESSVTGATPSRRTGTACARCLGAGRQVGALLAAAAGRALRAATPRWRRSGTRPAITVAASHRRRAASQAAFPIRVGPADAVPRKQLRAPARPAAHGRAVRRPFDRSGLLGRPAGGVARSQDHAAGGQHRPVRDRRHAGGRRRHGAGRSQVDAGRCRRREAGETARRSATRAAAVASILRAGTAEGAEQSSERSRPSLRQPA